MSFLHAAEEWVVGLAQYVPVEQFVIFGAAIEEIVAPIPSPIIMTVAGSIAQAQNQGYLFLTLLALLGALSKTAASWLVYVISDKAEDIVVGRFGKYLGVTSKEIESIGKYFNGGVRDMVIMFLARAIPIMPTAPVSIVSGIIKVNMKSYMVGTFLGTLVRSYLYLLLGFVGLASAESILSGFDSAEKVVQLLMAVVGGTLLLLMYYRRSKETDILGTIKRWFRLK
jgi:membrane protein DedA with SNARE-associated domain